MALDAFTRFGNGFTFSSRPALGRQLYEQIKEMHGGAYGSDSFSGPIAGFWFAFSMAVARAYSTLERTKNQADPLKAYDLLSVLEGAFGIEPEYESTVAQRREVLAAAMKLAAGPLRDNVVYQLSTALGSDFVAWVTAPGSAQNVYPQGPIGEPPWQSVRSQITENVRAFIGDPAFWDDFTEGPAGVWTADAVGDLTIDGLTGWAVDERIGTNTLLGSPIGVVVDPGDGATAAVVSFVVQPAVPYRFSVTDGGVYVGTQWGWEDPSLALVQLVNGYERPPLGIFEPPASWKMIRLQTPIDGVNDVTITPPGIPEVTLTTPEFVSESVIKTASVIYTHVAGDETPLQRDGLGGGDHANSLIYLMVEPGRYGRQEVVAVIHTPATNRFYAHFKYSHEEGVLAIRWPFPFWLSHQKHSLVVVKNGRARDPGVQAKTNALLTKLLGATSTWDVVEENVTPGTSGPFYPGEGMPGITPVQQVTF